jgi:REP element-mobilizing transposase RayT
MNRGLARTRIFLADEDRNRFLDLLGDTCELWKVKIYAYCLMDNHYHLLLQTTEGNLSRVMRHLDGIYTQRFNRAHHRDGPLFRGRYRAILIDAEEYFLAVVRYIHWNPIEAKLPPSTDGYRWSSHRGFLKRRQCPAWLEREEVLSRFGKGDEALEKYLQFIGQGIEPELKQFYRDAYQRPILGDKDFVQWVKEKLGKRAQVSQEIPESRKTFGYGLEEIVRAVSAEYGIGTEKLWKKRRGIENEARGMAIYLSRALGGYKLVEIGKLIGLENYSSVSSAYLSMKRRIEEDRRLSQRADEIKRVLKGQKQT